MVNKLVRWRADPKQIKVSIIRLSHGLWGAKVLSLKDNRSAIASEADPKVAVLTALTEACKADFPGIDLNMEYTYPHPWKQDEK